MIRKAKNNKEHKAPISSEATRPDANRTESIRAGLHWTWFLQVKGKSSRFLEVKGESFVANLFLTFRPDPNRLVAI